VGVQSRPNKAKFNASTLKAQQYASPWRLFGNRFLPSSCRSIALKGTNNCIQKGISQCPRVGHGTSLFAVGENRKRKYFTGIIKDNITHFCVNAADG